MATDIEMKKNLIQGPGAPVASVSDLKEHTGLIISQETSECCRFCCCQPNIHWKAHTAQKDLEVAEYDKLESLLHIEEDAPYFGRCMSHCMPGWRTTTYTVRQGGPEGKTVMTHDKDTTCGVSLLVLYGDSGPIRCPMCCCLPYLRTKDANGTMLGETRYLCDSHLCVPKFGVMDASGTMKYLLRPDTCCLGCCVSCTCCDNGKGAHCCRIPYYIRDPVSREPLNAADGDGKAAVSDLWAGLKRECCQKKNWYQIKFPENCDPGTKATLIGSTLLLDIAVAEQEQ